MRLANLFEIGISVEMPVEAKRRVVFSNAVYLVVGGLLLASSVSRISYFLNPSSGIMTYIPVFIVLVSGLCVFLNKIHFFLISKVFFVLVWIILIVVYPVVAIGPKPTSYFMHPYFSILFSPVIQLLFSFKSERVFYIFFLVVFFLLAAFSLDFLLMFDRSPDPRVPLLKTITGFRINLIIIWLFLNLLMIYVLRINSKLYDALESKNELIKNQNVILDEQSVQLSQQNKILEERVAERTLSLMEQNMKLREYTFMHSHVLRAPLSRIRGLMNLLSLAMDKSEETRIRELISKSVDELDEVAKTMGNKLDNTNKTGR